MGKVLDQVFKKVMDAPKSINAFIQTCSQHNIRYSKILCFEPDPNNYQALIKNTEDKENVFCHQLG